MAKILTAEEACRIPYGEVIWLNRYMDGIHTIEAFLSDRVIPPDSCSVFVLTNARHTYECEHADELERNIRNDPPFYCHNYKFRFWNSYPEKKEFIDSEEGWYE